MVIEGMVYVRVFYNNQLVWQNMQEDLHELTVLETKATLLAFFFFLNDPATTEIYPFPLHDAFPILVRESLRRAARAAASGLAAHPIRAARADLGADRDGQDHRRLSLGDRSSRAARRRSQRSNAGPQIGRAHV